MRDDTKKSKFFGRRSFIIGCAQLLTLAAFDAKMYYMQVIEGQKYRNLADGNRVRVSVFPAIRGNILDRNGTVLAYNNIIHRIVTESKNIEEIKRLVIILNTYLEQPIVFSTEKLHSMLKNATLDSYIVLKDNLTWLEIVKVESNLYHLGKISINQQSQRYYPYGEITGHVTGYLGLPTTQEIINLSVPNVQDFMVGKNGIEKNYEKLLQGTPGVKKTEVDARNIIIRQLSVDNPTAGSNIKLSLNIKLQQYIKDLLSNKASAVVVMDPDTGQVLAMVSNPSYNPNDFVFGISKSQWQELNDNTKTPLINKCISAAYPPGSTFKVVPALAALENGISPEMEIHCTGEHKVGNRVFHCWKHSGHGKVNMNLALAQSCNIYFYRLAEMLTIQSIAKIGKTLGLGEKTGIELPFESSGVMPDNIWKLKKYQKKWLLGDTTNASIGQGYVLTTIIQLANMLARLVSAREVIPSIVLEDAKIMPKLNINNAHLEIVKQGMYAAFNKPYGKNYNHRLYMPDFEFSGKSGTAQIASLENGKRKGISDHGLFIGFAPYESPRYTIAAIVENGGWGSASAMPIVRKIVEYLRELEQQ